MQLHDHDSLHASTASLFVCRLSAEMSENREASRAIEAELEVAAASASAALATGVGRFTLGSGFLFLGGFTMRLFPFACAAVGLRERWGLHRCIAF